MFYENSKEWCWILLHYKNEIEEEILEENKIRTLDRPLNLTHSQGVSFNILCFAFFNCTPCFKTPPVELHFQDHCTGRKYSCTHPHQKKTNQQENKTWRLQSVKAKTIYVNYLPTQAHEHSYGHLDSEIELVEVLTWTDSLAVTWTFYLGRSAVRAMDSRRTVGSTRALPC